MGVVSNFISDRFIPKEKTEFYVETMKLVSTSVEEIKTESELENEFALSIIHKENEFILRIKSYEHGIFNLSFDLKDPSIKYKNKVEIGKNLKPKKFKNIIKDNESVTLIIEDDPFENNSKEINTYKLIINLSDFEIYYYMNEDLLITFNQKHTINLLNDTTKNLKSNIFDFQFQNIDQCYGLPERPQSLFLKDGNIRLYNTDDPGQIPESRKPTYGSIPMIHGVNKNYIVTVFNNNSSENIIEIKSEKRNKNKNILWITEGGIIDIYLTSDNNYYQNHKKIAEITGYSIMPPLWALGYHQCRWGYKNCDDIISVEKKFNELNIPVDCFWMDIDHTNGKRYFTWDPENFSNAKEFLENLKNDHKYFVTIIDPHIKVDENYFVCKLFKENDCYVKQKNEKNELENYIGECWPGESYYVDFLNYEKVLPFYKNLYQNEEYFLNYKNHGTWVDMNEPAVFETKDKSMPKTNIHNDGTKLVEHKEVHNIYGYFYQKTMHEALKSRIGNDKRDFTLSRSFYAGTQQNGFVWTGDQKSNFDFLNNSIESNMINGLCGLSGTGTDVGGFLDNPTSELMKVWYSLGIFYVFFRGHSDISTIRREPWLFEKSVCDSIINSIKLRYHLLMYVYTKYYEHVKNGVPVLKPMWMKFRENYDDFIKSKEQGCLFVFGDELIGCNHYVMTNNDVNLLKKIKVPLYDLVNGNIIDDNFGVDKEKMIQGLVIGGNIIPWTNKAEKCSYYVMREPLSLRIFVDIEKYAIGKYYLDDGITENGEFIYINFELKDNVLKISNLNKKDEYKEINDLIPVLDKVEIYGYGEIKSSKYDSKEIKVDYNKEKNVNVLDLLNENIKVNNDLEITLGN